MLLLAESISVGIQHAAYRTITISHSSGMQEWVVQIPSIPILVSVLFPSLHIKYFRTNFLLLVGSRIGEKRNKKRFLI